MKACPEMGRAEPCIRLKTFSTSRNTGRKMSKQKMTQPEIDLLLSDMDLYLKVMPTAPRIALNARQYRAFMRIKNEIVKDNAGWLKPEWRGIPVVKR